MNCCWFLPLFPIAAFFAFNSPAQNSAPAAPASAANPPVIRTQANLVLVDVVVSDRGKPVEALTVQHFHILENGKEQRIAVFEEHRSSDAPQVGPAPSLPPNVYSNYPKFAVASAANVLLLDALNTPLSDQSYVRHQMVEYLRKIPAGTKIAVFTMASQLRMIEGFTTDAGALETAITKGKGNPQQSVILESPQQQDTMNDVASSISGADGGMMQQFLADQQSFQTDLRVRMTLDAMQQLGRYLSTIPGRKNLIWFSGSFPLHIDPQLQGSAPIDPLSPMRDYSDQVKETDDLLSAARVAVYPVDARGLMGLPSMDASRSFSASSGMPPMGSSSGRGRSGAGLGGGSGQSAAQKTNAQFQAQTIAEHQAMQQIAEETGGEAFYNTNGLKEAVARAIENGSNYFTIGYVPAEMKWDGSYRRIEVQVDDGKYDLGYRRGYFADDPLKPTPHRPGAVSPIAAALERGAPPLSQIVFEARVLGADDPAAKQVKVSAAPAGELTQSLKTPVHRYLVDFAVDPRGITWGALPGGQTHAEIELSVVAWDADGKRVNYTDRGFAVNLDAQQSAATAKSGLPLHQEIDLPAGEVYLRVAVHDLPSGRIGSLEIPVMVAKH